MDTIIAKYFDCYRENLWKHCIEFSNLGIKIKKIN